MTNRRQFVQGATVTAMLSGMGLHSSHSQSLTQHTAAPMRILMLGATGFIGPHFIQAAIQRGHSVAIFSRGQTTADLPPNVEQLTGDRNGDLRSISNRDWDAVIDLATYIPVWVRTLGAALKGRVRHYTFISTESVYQYPGAVDEKSTVRKYAGAVDAYSASAKSTSTEEYGALKALCEREAERQFPGKALVLRPGSILGPGDDGPHHSYWAIRMKRGGEILVPGGPFARVQMIDVRDLAEWAISMAERSETGVFNANGPAMPMTWVEMLGGIRGTLSVPLTLTWVSAQWLAEKKVPGLYTLQFWPSEAGMPGFMHIANDKALRKGLTFRPWSTTVTSILAWYEALPIERQKDLFSKSGDTGPLADFIAHEQAILTMWHAQQKKNSP